MSRKTIVTAGGVVLVVALLAGGWLAFQNMRESPPEAAKPEQKLEEEIVLPDALDKDKKAILSQDVLVSEEKKKESKRARLTGYICDEKLSGGTLRGVCYVPFDKELELYPPMPLELTGTNAIQDPRPGEVEYFQNRPPLTPVWLGPYFKGKKRYGVRGAMVIIKDVAAGKVRNLDSVNFLLDYRSHYLEAQKPSGENVLNPSWFNIGFAPPGELIRVTNLTLYDSEFVVKRADTGTLLREIKLKGYADDKHPGAHFGTYPGMQDPPVGEFPRIREPGLYAIEYRRHPWQKAWLYVADNPYVTLTNPEARGDGGAARSGEFSIAGIPPGKYTVEIWHPEYEPVKKTYTVEILPDQETELAVEFKPPPVLNKEPVTYPSKPITEWAFIGPFEPTDDAVDAEVKKIDFGAGYNGKYDRVRWEKASLPKDGRDAGWFKLNGRWEPRVEGSAFLATRFDSPAPQRLMLRVWSHWLNPQVLLNGKSIFYTVDSREFAYGNEVIVAGDLKQGANTLLVRVTGAAGDNDNGHGLRVSYLPEGIEPRAPDISAGAALADASRKGSVILTDSTYWRCYLTRGPLRLNPMLLKDEKYLAAQRDLDNRGLQGIERETKTLTVDKKIDWTKTDWRNKALWFPWDIYYQSPAMVSMVPQTPPPANWMQPDFNDGEWMVLWHTPVADQQAGNGTMVWNWYMRTDFTVPDGVQPGDLSLNLSYHGGARVFVNGAEVARGHLPQGELGPDVPAEEYPMEAYLAQPDELAGSPVLRQIPDLRTPFYGGGESPKKELERYRSPGGYQLFITQECWNRIRKLRDRELGPVTIPAKLLRKGRNVLSVEIRGSLFHPDVWTPDGEGGKVPSLHWVPRQRLGWAHAELLSFELRDASGAVPPVMEPRKGLQVWAEDMHTRVLNVHTRPASMPVGTVRMVGALNGTYSGMVVMRCDGEIADLKVNMSDLKGVGGPGAIASGMMTVAGMVGRPLNELYWTATGGRENATESYRLMATQASFSPLVPKREKTEDWKAWFDKISSRVLFYDQIGQSIPDRVPAQTVQPLWLSLKVPMETEPGVYKGSLTIQSRGQAAAVPVEVEVIGWRVPNPLEFKTDVWLEQHPYAIANHYLLPKNAEAKPTDRNWEGPVKAKVPLWSDEHFKLLEPSFRQLARVGNDVLHIPVVIRTEFGNWQDSMIRWTRKKDGTYAFDYTALDRYLDLATKYLGRVRVVDFVVMHCQYSGVPNNVMAVDEASGKTEELNIGWNGDAFMRLPVWKTFAASLLRHMKEKGLEHSVYWGHGGDYEPDPGLVTYLFEVFPGTYWAASGHTYSGGAGGGGHSRNIVRCFSDVYGSPKPLTSAMGWKGPAIGDWRSMFRGEFKAERQYKSYRADETYLYVHNPRDYCQGPTLPIKWRSLPAHALREGYSGIGRCGLDGYDGDWMSGTHMNDWGFPGRPCNMLTWPGANGAESSARFEALLEGIQETEARIFLEQAMDSGHIGPDIAEEARRVLDDHIRPAMMGLGMRDGAPEEYIYPWQSGSRQLLKMAAKVAGIVGVDINNPYMALKVPALGLAKRSFKIRNWTGKLREWKAAVSAPWIVPQRTGGKLLGFEDFTFTVDGKTLKPGETVNGEIVITDTANGQASKFEVTAAVEPPVIVTYEHPHFNVACGRSETREFRIVNLAVSDQDWQLSAPVPWIKIEPSSGTLKAGEELNIKLTATPPDKQAVYENAFVFKGAGGLVNTKFVSKTFVIPLLREKDDRAMPPGKIVKIEDMARQFKSAVFCKNGTIIESGPSVREWGKSFMQKLNDPHSLFSSPVYQSSAVSGASFLPLIGKEKFSRAIWCYPHFEAVYNVEGLGITGFSAYVGITKDARERMIRHHQYRANFEIYVDGEVRAQSGLMLVNDEPRYLTLENIKNAKEFKLVTRLDCDKDDPAFVCTWADAQFYEEREAPPTKADEKK